MTCLDPCPLQLGKWILTVTWIAQQDNILVPETGKDLFQALVRGIITNSDFVTNSYGETLDSSCEKSWDTIQKTMSLFL